MKPLDWTAIDAQRGAMPVPRLQVTHSEEDQVKYETYDFTDRERFPKRLNQVEIIHITDMQLGSKKFLRSKFLKYRQWILSVPNRFVVLGGDIVDAATLLSIGSPYDNTGEPIEQVEEAVAILQPLADACRILGYVGGNHERRTAKTFGDCGRLIGRALKVPYSGGIQVVDIRYGRHQPFSVALWHGGGAARTKGAKAMMLDRFMHKVDAHLYFVGHLHDSVILPAWRMVRENGRLVQQKIMGVMSSSFQGYWNSYAEQMALDPSETLMGRAILYPDGKWEVTLR